MGQPIMQTVMVDQRKRHVVTQIKSSAVLARQPKRAGHGRFSRWDTVQHNETCQTHGKIIFVRNARLVHRGIQLARIVLTKKYIQKKEKSVNPQLWTNTQHEHIQEHLGTQSIEKHNTYLLVTVRAIDIIGAPKISTGFEIDFSFFDNGGQDRLLLSQIQRQQIFMFVALSKILPTKTWMFRCPTVDIVAKIFGSNDDWILVVAQGQTPVQPQPRQPIVFVVVDLNGNFLPFRQIFFTALGPTQTVDVVVVHHHGGVNPQLASVVRVQTKFVLAGDGNGQVSSVARTELVRNVDVGKSTFQTTLGAAPIFATGLLVGKI